VVHVPLGELLAEYCKAIDTTRRVVGAGGEYISKNEVDLFSIYDANKTALDVFRRGYVYLTARVRIYRTPIRDSIITVCCLLQRE